MTMSFLSLTLKRLRRLRPSCSIVIATERSEWRNLYSMKKTLIAILVLVSCTHHVETVSDPVDYVSTLTGSLSHHAYSTGNTYPAVALPWGMNFWTPQGEATGRKEIYGITIAFL